MSQHSDLSSLIQMSSTNKTTTSDHMSERIDQNTAKFWDKIAAKYAKKPIKNIEAYHLTMGKTQAHLSSDDHVLEIGCGSGATAIRLANHVKHIIASDISGNMIKIGRGKAKDNNITNITFEQSTLSNHSHAKQSFDAVLAFNILHLLKDLQTSLAQITEILKPGGLVISKTTCLGEKPGVFRFIIPPMRLLGLAPYVAFLSIKELETSFEKHGLKIIEAENHPKSSTNRFVVAQKQ